ncbi:hypothetical protein [Streptomyces sp. NPDC002172]
MAVLRDRAEGRDLWHVGIPGSEPGQLVLHPDGRLVLEAWPAAPLRGSGDIDRRVAAAVTDQGRLVLTDPDGGLRWSRDPLSEAELAAYRPATGCCPDRCCRRRRTAAITACLASASACPANRCTASRAPS